MLKVGGFRKRLKQLEDALKLAVSEGNAVLAEALRQVIGLYQAGKPYHQPQR